MKKVLFFLTFTSLVFASSCVSTLAHLAEDKFWEEFNTDGNAYIEGKELEEVIAYEAKALEMSQELAEEKVMSYDEDKDGKLNKEEYAPLINSLVKEANR